ncbi:MAG: hypothetical protein RIR70_997, partial [Pseudomonadota bacterium]
LAMADPTDVALLDQLRGRGLTITAVVAGLGQLRECAAQLRHKNAPSETIEK